MSLSKNLSRGYLGITTTTGGVFGIDESRLFFSTITYINSTSDSIVAGNININVPSGSQSGDLLLLIISHGGGSATFTAPSGWSTLTDGTLPSNGPKLEVFYRSHNGSDESVLLVGGSSGDVSLHTFRGQTLTTITNSQGPVGGAVPNLTIANNNSYAIHVTALNTAAVPNLSTGFASLTATGTTRGLRVAVSNSYQSIGNVVNPSTADTSEFLFEIY